MSDVVLALLLLLPLSVSFVLALNEQPSVNLCDVASDKLTTILLVISADIHNVRQLSGTMLCTRLPVCDNGVV